MSKKFKKELGIVIGIIVSIAFTVGLFLVGFKAGYEQGTKNLVQEYEQGIKDCAGAISSMYSYYPDELNSPDGQVITKLIQHEDYIRILWVKNNNGRLTHGIVTTYDQLPVVK